jgi:tetratricopeptide (TPR) repeat protein
MDKWNRISRFFCLLNLAWLLQTQAGAAEPSIQNSTTAPSAPAPVAPDAPNIVTNATPAVDPAKEITGRFSDEAMRSYLHLQEQLHAAKLAIEQARLEASVEAESNLGAMMVRMESLEKELSNQRALQAESAHRSDRILIFAAAGIFLAGIAAIILTVILQARGMNRLAEIATGISAARGLPALTPLTLSSGDRLLLPGGAVEANRLQSTISRLEGRIREIEVTAEAAPENGQAHLGSRAAILGRVNTLVNLGQDEAALQALEEAIVRQPDDATLHLRKGIVLERLKRQSAALESYDRAITLDGTCTQAYLAKGGILNQQERYQEALACFEHALANRTPSVGLHQS